MSECGRVPGGGRGRIPQVRVHVQISEVLAERIAEHIKKTGTAVSLAEFMRMATVEKIDRVDREERGLGPPLDLNQIGDPVQRARNRLRGDR